MKIIVTANSAWSVWNFRRRLITALLADGHEITILAPTDNCVADLENLGCRFLPLSMDVKGLSSIAGIRLLYRFLRIFSRERPDAVLGYTIKNNIVGAIAAQFLRIPFIPNITGLGTAFLSGSFLLKFAELLYRIAFLHVPIVFFQNEDDLSLFVRRRLVHGLQARLLPGSGIDLTKFSPVPMPEAQTAPVFLMIARLLRDKGVSEFVEAARAISATDPSVRFQLLGQVGSQNRSAIDAETLQGWISAGIVEYLGEVDDVRPHIAAATCIVLPSYREGAPRSLMEAAAMARPVITTNVPGCRSVVDQDISGFLCEVRAAASLIAAMRRFLALRHQEREMMGRAGRLKMEREFDEEIVVEAYRNAISFIRTVPREETMLHKKLSSVD